MTQEELDGLLGPSEPADVRNPSEEEEKAGEVSAEKVVEKET